MYGPDPEAERAMRLFLVFVAGCLFLGGYFVIGFLVNHVSVAFTFR